VLLRDNTIEQEFTSAARPKVYYIFDKSGTYLHVTILCSVLVWTCSLVVSIIRRVTPYTSRNGYVRTVWRTDEA